MLIHNSPMEQGKRPRGAPKKENPEDDWIGFRVSPDRKERYERAARKAGQALSAWIKKVLDRASR
jgi:predicted HicB family RNase H-like nuclease